MGLADGHDTRHRQQVGQLQVMQIAPDYCSSRLPTWFSSTVLDYSIADFDLELLEDAHFLAKEDYAVPSPSLEAADVSLAHSPSMFSPGGDGLKSPTSDPTSSRHHPYERRTTSTSAAVRGAARLSSTETTCSSRSSPTSLHDAMAEYHSLRSDLPSTSHQAVDVITATSEANDARVPERASDVSMEPVISLVVEQAKRDIASACTEMQIDPDPCVWSRSAVGAWLSWTLRQYGLEPTSAQHVAQNVDGQQLLRMREEDFIAAMGEGGHLVFGQLDIWRSTAMTLATAMPPAGINPGNVSFDEDDENVPVVIGGAAEAVHVSIDEEELSDDDEAAEPSSGRASSSSSPIHLWQFMKELLNAPQQYSGCIHWLDRDRGVFRIIDSARVATLWGQRKNRPAMNYDKLSRSLRQYYKKGIMKKTERSQRLVYQFCHPYHL